MTSSLGRTSTPGRFSTNDDPFDAGDVLPDPDAGGDSAIDAASADASRPSDAGSDASASPDAGAPSDAGRDSAVLPDAGTDAGCVPEEDAALCARFGKDCDLFTAADNCGVLRTVSCGTCEGVCTANVCCVAVDPCGDACDVEVTDTCGETVSCACTGPDVCGGGGTPEVCAAHPPLVGVGGYILDMLDGRFRIVFATDGVPSSGGACCFASVVEARAAYPSRSLAYLPGQTELTAGVVPTLTGVDGYIFADAADRYRIGFALNGALTGGGYCCASTLAEARAAYPTSNLVVLP